MVRIEQASFGSDAYPESLFRLYAADPNSWFVLARDPSAVGYLITRTDRWGIEVVSIAVLPHARRRGIGRALLRAVIRRAKRQRAATIRLMVRADNLAALAFYRQQGFRSIGRIPNYYEDGAPAIRMRLAL